MIMRDYITANERLSLVCDELIYFSEYECVGCGQTSEEIAEKEGWNDDDFEENSRRTVEGNWYCNIDCFRDSRG